MKKHTYVLILLLFLFINIGHCYNIGKITLTKKNPTYTNEFTLKKVENFTYKLTFTHYGIMNKSGVIYILLNGKIIYKIDKNNKVNINNKPYPTISIDIAHTLKNGKNILEIYALNLNNHNYYVLNNVYINEPTKTPISTKLELCILILMSMCIIGFYKSRRI
ncbi:conserved hypothetical protein [Methanocaldococcus vulcanius M7]|uniref:Uncharacterized protein n=1 Tax=Methanocaldococcus vulcanius (strain ATCC 700851 / DSM 12094 / M7) TaxID=579137 RepID=C9REE2_METVM|nr:hypothetical protein [Methanocaldococcus vulcanius]ACX71944.1 conserved hypothetical protein [Methanocaldococcus vulcanius M7]